MSDSTSSTEHGAATKAKGALSLSDKRQQQIGVAAAVAGVVIGYLLYRSTKKAGSSGSSSAADAGAYRYPAVSPGGGGSSPSSSDNLLQTMSNNFQQLTNKVQGITEQQNTEQAYLNAIQMGTQMAVVGIGYGNPGAVGSMAGQQYGYATRANPGTGWVVPGQNQQQPYGAVGTAPFPTGYGAVGPTTGTQAPGSLGPVPGTVSPALGPDPSQGFILSTPSPAANG